jgi:hypothetical protein
MKIVVCVVFTIATTVWAHAQWRWEGAGPAGETRISTIAVALPPPLRPSNSMIDRAPGSLVRELSQDLDIERPTPFCFESSDSDVSTSRTELSILKSEQTNGLTLQSDCLVFPLSPQSSSGLLSMNTGQPLDTLTAPATMIRAAEPRRSPDANGREPVQWTPLARQSLAYLGIMHTFRIATEPSTRNAMSNAVIGGYFRSLGAMHGWSDGDGYYENYLGHPIEGAVSGYLWIHNDPRYRNVEFGRGRDYWMSRLRAYAFAWAFSEQFEIGLFSEASIGQIQRYCCAYGFVDHVITPNGGALWIIGGDILDKYVTRRIEDHTRNTAVRAIARGVLNPSLSFANFVAGEYPWHRENRPGVRAYDGQLYLRAKNPQPADEQQVPSFELTATLPSVLRLGGLSCLGGGGIGGFRVTDSWQWTAEVSGCSFGNFEKNWSGDSLTFSTGPQWISHTSSRWSPHFGMRIGGQKITHDYVDPVIKQRVLKSLPAGKSSKEVHDEYTKVFETTGVSLAISGGVNLRLNRALALRVANVDYIRSWLDPINGYDLNQGYRVSTGLVLRMGTW